MSLLHTRSYIRVRSLPQRYIYHYPIRHYVTVQLKQRASTIYTPLSSVVADGGGKRVEHEDGMLRYPPLQQLLLHHDAGKTFLKVGCFQENRNIFRQGIGKILHTDLSSYRDRRLGVIRIYINHLASLMSTIVFKGKKSKRRSIAKRLYNVFRPTSLPLYPSFSIYLVQQAPG